MEGNKRHPQFTLESDTKQTHFFVERTLLPRAPFARRGFIHIGKRQIKTRGFVETVLKSRKTFVVRRQKQSSIQTHSFPFKTVREIPIESAHINWNNI